MKKNDLTYEVAPLSSSEMAESHVACALSMLRERFPGVITLMRPLSEQEASEAGAQWIADAFFVPSPQLLEFEDFVDDLSVDLSSEHNVRVLIISHTEEATKQYYLETLNQLAPFELENRGGGADYFEARTACPSSPSWHLPEHTVVVDVMWPPSLEPGDRMTREAA
ncbi:MAG: hypothetical protein JXL80_18160 [Planctomycetes bacterium]|nr:hypothetical protein [Planctomycetota bacterium]